MWTLGEAVFFPYHEKSLSPHRYLPRMSSNATVPSEDTTQVKEPSDSHHTTHLTSLPTVNTASGSGSSRTSYPGKNSESPAERVAAEARVEARANFNSHVQHTRRRRRRRTLFGIRNTALAHAQRGNDPFDYEQKYPDDEVEFAEMGPMARIWKVFLDECGSFDAEMVDDWRDALDVLLVFAGLFSAVVTTFVAQTCQDLKPDFAEINVYLMYESLAMERAKANGTSVLEVPPSKLNPFTPFRATRSDIWVNGLWFTSLALSLTTALLAVLTKQWIHQYLSVPSGTPRDRCRVRQFRFMSLQTWHVPVIIGLLPVLMHVSLGVFFAGLVVFLFSLNSAISAVIGSIAVLAFAAYFTTNLIPLFRIDCPYKTPLTLYTHNLFAVILPILKRFIEWLCRRPKPVNPAISTPWNKQVVVSPGVLNLKAMELSRVQAISGSIDARSLSWLYTVSSNSSVQRLVLQALGNMPIEDVPVFQREVPSVSKAIYDALSEHCTPERRYGHQRLLRASIRFSDEYPKHGFGPEQPVENTLFDLLHPINHENAMSFLSHQIIHCSVEYDVVTWARILESALRRHGIDFLEIGVAGSKVWPTFVYWFTTIHFCDDRVHNRNKLTKSSFCRTDIGIDCKLAIYSADKVMAPPKSTNVGMDIRRAFLDFLYPSLCDLLLSIISPHASDVDPSLPCDIRVQLGLLNVKAVQSCTEVVNSFDTPFQIIVENLRAYIAIDDSGINASLTQHPGIVRAAFSSVHSVVNSDTFRSLIPRRCQLDLLHVLFRALVLDGRLRADHKQAMEGLAPKVLQTLFQNPMSFSHPIVAEILEYVSLSGSCIGPEVYRTLLERCFIDEVERRFARMPSDDPAEKGESSNIQRRDGHAFPWFVSSLVDGLEVLEHACPDVHAMFVAYLRQPRTVFVLYKILILADVDTCNRLWKLARIVDPKIWASTCSDITEFLHTKEASRIHGRYRDLHGRHPCHSQVKLVLRPFEDLPGLVGQLSEAAQWPRDAFPLVMPLYSSPRQIEAFLTEKWVD